MNDALPVLDLESIKAALAASGQSMSDEQVRALGELIGSLGGIHPARAAVEQLAQMRDAA